MSDREPGPDASYGTPRPELSRRDFLNEITIGALGIAGLGGAALSYQYFSPNVLFEPSVTFLQEQQVYIVRTPAGFYAVSSVCTHLGCITQWKPEANIIACPCHGSKFQPNGKKIEGPAPRPLPHYAINLTADGELQVDKLQIIKGDQVLRV